MTESAEGLVSIRDFIRWGASRFNAAGLFFGHGTDNAFDEAAVLVLHAIDLPPDLPADYLGCRLTVRERRAVTELLEARIRERKPAAYVTNKTWFAGLEFHVTEDVLVPRSPLAELIESGFEPWMDAEQVGRVLDLCTGSGCIGIAAAVHLPDVEVDLSDISEAALNVARRNLSEHNVDDRVRVIHSDLFAKLAGRRYDVIVSNPPYVGAEELASLPPEYQREPSLALAGGETGLDLVIRILLDAPEFLNDDGILVIEVGNTAEHLERTFPDIPFLWLDFERGGEGVFLMRKPELLEYRSLFEEASTPPIVRPQADPMDQSIAFDLELIRRYDRSGPRYTSYPTAVELDEGFGEDAYKAACAASNVSGNPLSLYFHIPFCDTVCFYCACNKIATKDRTLSQPYLDRVYRELELQSVLFDPSRRVEQLHWGGGTPTFLSHDEMTGLMDRTRRHFNLADDANGEYSIEIDPREADAETVALLRRLGFNRMSLGVQDFDPDVQVAVNRVQTEAETVEVLEAARSEGFRSISVDLIYGLPFQNRERFLRTLERVVAVAPDRLSVFNYAHLPERFKPQRRINEADLPSAPEKLEILQSTIDFLVDAGYIYIGMDHFARPDDELAKAQRDKTLYRNFQGYSTHADCDLIGLGVTSIGKVANTYSQNVRTLDEYYGRLDQGRLPVFRGIELTRDDEIRRDVITRLICHFELHFADVETRWAIAFRDYFVDDLRRLEAMAADGLLRIADDGIRVLPPGRLLIRNICMAFDAYLAHKQGPIGFSKVI